MAFIDSTNLLVRAMTADDRAALAESMEMVDLPVRHDMLRPDTPITHVFFPDDGIGSTVAIGGEKEVEVGIFGRDGLSAPAVLLGVDTTPHICFLQIEGRCWRIEVGAFETVMRARATLRALLLRYVHVMLVQAAYTVKAAAISRIDQRLARWLLMCHDRVDGDELTLTHQFMAMMLGTRRAGVTDALHLLEGDRLIVAQRGRIVVRDRAGLERLAGATYGVPEAEYERLIGQRLSRGAARRGGEVAVGA